MARSDGKEGVSSLASLLARALISLVVGAHTESGGNEPMSVDEDAAVWLRLSSTGFLPGRALSLDPPT